MWADKTTSQTHGFSLVEVLISGTVLVITMVALATTMYQGHQITTEVQNELIARRAIRSKMAEIRATPFDEIQDVYHGQRFETEGLRGEPKEDLSGYKDPLAVAIALGPETGVYRITLTATWSNGGKARRVSQAYLLSELLN